MERWQLVHEHNNLLESLTEKTKFLYSEKFFLLSQQERQKYINEKMAEEAHLKALSALLWDNTSQSIGFTDLFSMGLLSSMFSASPVPTSDIKECKTE